MRGGSLSDLDMNAHASLCSLVRDLVVEDLVLGVHDVADGGIALALAEMAVRTHSGLRVAGVRDIAGLFAEHPSRAIVCLPSSNLAAVVARAESTGVPATDVGVVGGDHMVIGDVLDLSLDELISAWRDRLPTALAGGTMQ
jgi:phosphoribosylformylglycinamidine synthase